MPREILVPTHLDVRIIPPGEVGAVAALDDDPRRAPTLPLEPGVHLHWALPDALSHGERDPDRPELVLPAVPDRWLVIRVAPPATEGAPRPTAAWVIDAVAATATPLAAWAPSAPAAGDRRLTALGLLDRGRLPIGDGAAEPLAPEVVYYPLARNRFGFHDRLDGVSPGTLSYLVVGWYAKPEDDPLDVSRPAQEAWLAARRLEVIEGAAATSVRPVIEARAVTRNPMLAPLIEAFRRAAPQPTEAPTTRADAPPPSRADAPPAATAAAAPAATGARASGMMRPLAELLDRLRASPLPAVAALLRSRDRMICHAAITGVRWRTAEPSRPPPPVPQAHLYGSLHEAAERYLADRLQHSWLQGAMRLHLGRAAASSLAYLQATWRAHDAGFVGHVAGDASAARFHAADAPVVLVDGLERSPRHGEDADLDPERRDGRPGRVRCRPAGHTLTGLATRVGPLAPAGLAAPVSASGLPSSTAALLEEVMLLDSANTSAMAARLVASAPGTSPSTALSAAAGAIAAWERLRDPKVARADDAAALVGVAPASYAVKGHGPTDLPLYAEVRGEVVPDPDAATGIPPGWQLGAVDLERPPGPAPLETIPSPTAATPIRFQVRRPLVPVLPRMIASATGLDELRPMRLLACALPEVDKVLPAGAAVRAGRVRVDHLRVIDTFGQTYPVVTAGTPPVERELVPRLAGWARLHARLLAATDPEVEADDAHPPVCGFLLADRVDHALEVFDHHGARVGQLRHVPGDGGGATRWEPDHARAVRDPDLPPSDPARVLGDAEPEAVLLAIARGVLAAPATATGSATAVSSLVDVLDNLQATAARATRGDEIGPLLGRPLAVVRMATRLERMASDVLDPRATAPLVETGDLTVPLAFGASVRADDGVFGTFAGDLARFVPVDVDALAAPGAAPASPAVTPHPYLDPTPVRALAAGARVVTTLLVDPRLTIHVRTGVLPAKGITMPATMYQPALRDLAPSLRIGPVLMPPARPWLPAPYLPGSAWRWLQPTARADDEAVALEEHALTPPGAGASLAETPAVIREGWLRRVPED